LRAGEQVLNFTIGKERLPFFVQDRDIVAEKIDVFARCTQAGSYHLVLSYVNLAGNTITSPDLADPTNLINLQPSDAYGGLKHTSINTTDAGLNLEELDIAGAMSLRTKRTTVADFSRLVTDPEDEVDDIYLVVHYKLVAP
jgi:hypothetical protein